jgi:hypothetical protein
MRWALAVALLIAPCVGLAQESALHAELRRERERASEACAPFKFKVLPGCAYTLFTDHPLHAAAGNLPPQNGFGVGPAFVWAWNPRNWRMSWDTDAVASFGGNWRAGSYLQMTHNPHSREPGKNPIHVIHHDAETATNSGAPSSPPSDKDFTHPYAMFNFYAQSISLNDINYFGVGNTSSLANSSVFGMRETIVGTSAIKPVYEWVRLRPLRLSISAEINGRFVEIRGEHGKSFPSIETRYNDRSAPGLLFQPGFLQMGQGIRIKPVILKRIELNYFGKLQEFVAPSSSRNSFLRWTVDLNHTYSLYGHTASEPPISIGPDSCAPGRDPCPPMLPPPNTSRNLNGSISVRLLVSESMTSATSSVPFYFQQTLGGSDLSGANALPSYQDYRFRGPNLLLMQQNFEHSVWGPFGIRLAADEGRVALTHGELGFDHLKHSFAGGLTLRAGGFPMVSLMFAWGGREGHHNIFSMNSSLLGGGARPQLY